MNFMAPPATPLGHLGRLPSELQEQICSHLFPRVFIIVGDQRRCIPSYRNNRGSRWKVHLAIFRTSRLVGEMASRYFYSHTLFIFQHDWLRFQDPRFPSLENRKRMRKVQITIPRESLNYLQRNNPPRSLRWFFEGLSLPASETEPKDTIRIIFLDAPKNMHAIGQTELFEHLESLCAFKTIIIEVTRAKEIEEDKEDGHRHEEHELSDSQQARLSTFLGVVLDQIRRKFAKVLVPDGKSKLKIIRGVNMFIRNKEGPLYSREVCFQPCQRQSTQSMLLEAAEHESGMDVETGE